jgi:starch phosphorylase
MEDNLGYKKIAYFSMEIAVNEQLPTYSGGLGILAGDLLRSAADLERPFVGITLLNRDGYFEQIIDNQDEQISLNEDNFPINLLEPLELKLDLRIGDEKVFFKAWRYDIVGQTGFVVPVYFLDTNVPENSQESRRLNGRLYGGDMEYRLKQEIILGRGGVKLLAALNEKIDIYHINEGHGALAGLELFITNKLNNNLVFTTHTPVPTGHDVFSLSLFLKLQPEGIKVLSERKMTNVNMTKLAASFAVKINAVSKAHLKIVKRMLPNRRVEVVTNGVHLPTWSLLPSGDDLSEQILWDSHQQNKKKLLDEVNKKTGRNFSIDILTIGFARRFTDYKRPLLLFSDLKKLESLQQFGRLQIIFAGKAHPNDFDGKEAIKKIIELIDQKKLNLDLVFLENYDMSLAKTLISGSDVWLNTPLPPNEASGTSGMKAAANGVLHLSTNDGWWKEADQSAGWTIKELIFFKKSLGADRSLYHLLETKVIPTYYHNRPLWLKMMKTAIIKNAAYFNTNRALIDYERKIYDI